MPHLRDRFWNWIGVSESIKLIRGVRIGFDGDDDESFQGFLLDKVVTWKKPSPAAPPRLCHPGATPDQGGGWVLSRALDFRPKDFDLFPGQFRDPLHDHGRLRAGEEFTKNDL